MMSSTFYVNNSEFNLTAIDEFDSASIPKIAFLTVRLSLNVVVNLAAITTIGLESTP